MKKPAGRNDPPFTRKERMNSLPRFTKENDYLVEGA
jgi:hypothetical protein